MELEGGGTLEIRQEGSRVLFRAERRRDDRGLYKVWLRGRGGEFLLGTLVPEGNVLGLDRSISRRELEVRNCWPVEGGAVRLFFSFAGGGNDGWAVISGLPDRVPDDLLRKSVRGELWGRQGEEGRYLVSCPFRSDRPVALEPLFCLGQVEDRGGSPWLVWAFDRTGTPELPASHPANMQDKY